MQPAAPAPITSKQIKMRNLFIEVVLSAQKVRYQKEMFSRAIAQETKSSLHCVRIFSHISLRKPRNKEIELEKKKRWEIAPGVPPKRVLRPLRTQNG